MKKAIILLVVVVSLFIVACSGNVDTLGGDEAAPELKEESAVSNDTIAEQTTASNAPDDVNALSEFLANPFMNIPSSEWREYQSAVEKLNRPLEEIDAMYFYLEVQITKAMILDVDYSVIEDMKTLLKNGEKDIADLLEQDMKEEGVWYEYINDSKKTTNSTAPTATPETTPKLNEPATSGELTFDDGGTLGIMLFEENGIRTATGLVNFNGESPEAELERILAAMYLFSELNIENYHIMGMSGDDYLMLVREDGKYDEVLTHIPESLSKLHDGSEFPDDSTNRIFAIVVDITEALICPFSHIRARVLALSGQ